MLMILVAYIIILMALVCCLWYIKTLKDRLRENAKSEKMKKAFLQNIHHEICVPLKAVKDLAGVVGKEDLYLSKNEKRNISDQLTYNANLVDTLFDEVVMFSENVYEEHQLHLESFSPNALCRRCLEANMFSIYHRQAVKLNFKRELNDEFFVKNDRHMVELVLNKLILNACRFTEVGEVLVGCNTSENTDQLTFFVEATGNGVPENRRNKLFTWFEKPEEMADEVELDLSICHRIAIKVGGALYMDENYHRRGTRFVFILPLRHS
jgi:K+-sensing histidine kinase KdpD